MHKFNPNDLIGRTFLLDKQENGEKHRARIVKQVKDHNHNLDEQPERVKFICSINNDLYEEILSYNEVLNHIENDQNNGILWKYKRIVGHEGPLTEDDETYNGSSYNIMIE